MAGTSTRNTGKARTILRKIGFTRPTITILLEGARRDGEAIGYIRGHAVRITYGAGQYDIYS